MPALTTWSLIVALTLAGQDPPPAEPSDGWAPVWAALERVQALRVVPVAERDSAAQVEADQALAVLVRFQRQNLAPWAGPVRSERQAFRMRVLDAHLARAETDDPFTLFPPGARVPAAAAPATYGPGEAWAAARCLVAGEERATAFTGALAHRGTELDPQRQLRRQFSAFAAFVEDEGAFRGEAALTIARAMHADARATWSAFCLEGIARRLGRYGEADGVLVQHLERRLAPQERIDVIQRRAICALGAGWTERARDHLGLALASDGEDAAQMLAREALSRARTDRARAVFRTLLGSDPTSTAPQTPWALRGWGLALLPAQGAH